MSDRSFCRVCNWRGAVADILKAPSPFDHEDEVWGCPKCKVVNELAETCDEPNCWVEASCGTPSSPGYRRTCWEHRPK